MKALLLFLVRASDFLCVYRRFCRDCIRRRGVFGSFSSGICIELASVILVWAKTNNKEYVDIIVLNNGTFIFVVFEA